MKECTASENGCAVSYTHLDVYKRQARELARRQRTASIQQELLRIGRECAALPVIDPRPADEILGYDEVGLPASW